MTDKINNNGPLRSGTLRLLVIEDSSGEQFECEVPIETALNEIAADFFEAQGFPTNYKAVVELVDPENPDRTKRLSGEMAVEEAGLRDGDAIRIFPESIAGAKLEPDPLSQENIYKYVDDLVTKRFDTLNYSNLSHPIFRGETQYNVEPDLCFVLMPYHNSQLEEIYRDHIYELLQPSVPAKAVRTIRQLRVKRADDISDNKAIIEDIWNNINRARVVIADLTGRNANVFYEVGMCHTIRKEVILLAQDTSDIPFDLQHLRVIIYKPTSRGCSELEEKLVETVNTILKREGD